jgi:CBS domain-containing protein
MSPRAAWLLEAIGFADVSHYLGGISDWAAAGLPIEGHLASELLIGALARRDVPTCAIDDAVQPILERMDREGWETCFVVNESRVVLGRLYRSDLRAGRGPLASDAMRPGPSTYRADVTARDMLARMTERDLKTAPVTTSDGRLVGLVRREDLRRALAAGRDSTAEEARDGVRAPTDQKQ